MSSDAPVAIVGIGCKFPGGSDTKELYYEFLRNKGDGMVEPPSDRWNHDEWMGGKEEPGKYHSTKGGFVSNLDLFDPLEFGISAKEAQHLDPSLRLTLEVAHQALHDSGIDYRGSKTGVYFAQLLTSTNELDDDRYEINSYNGVGKCIAIRANRVSFTFDLRGPSLTVDTACSSSGTAMHLALCAVKLGEVDQALVLGASTMVNPEHTVSFSKLGVLSPTGSSKSFDAAADGYARAEGFGAVLIKRLDAAVRDRDTIYSVITGSSINANGKGKSLTMPEGDMQAEAIKQAYANANRDPSSAFYVELHATGTAVGDPIEANAAGKIFSKGRDPSKVLRVGSVKSNIGHSEGTSFLASLIKVSLMLHNKEIIPNIRFSKPNPKIQFGKGMMKVQTELEKITPDLAAPDGKWVTSISSYGVGGSNAHVVVETFETANDVLQHTTTETSAEKPLYIFPVGSLTETSLARWGDALTEAYKGVTDDKTLRSLSRDLGRQARAYPARAFAVAPFLSSETKFSKPTLINSDVDPKLCLVFSGQGPQHIFMGKELAASYPAFLDAVKLNDQILVTKYGQPSMLERTKLFIPGSKSTLAPNGVWPVQDVVYSLVFIQMALVDLIRSLGIRYEYVVGHSIGEIAMGYASGHYDRETTIGIAVARAAAMTKADGNGCMVALGVGVQKAKAMIKKVLANAKATTGLWVAGINSPQAVTVAGKEDLIDAMVELAADPNAKVFAAKLRVTCAFHTPLMEPQEDIFKSLMKTALSKGTNPPHTRVMSTVEGKWLDRDLDIDYCWDNIRRPVLFGSAIDKLVKENGAGDVLFLEIAPHPVLKAYIEQCGGEPISLIRRPNPKVPAQNTGEHYQLLEGIGNLLGAGFKRIDLAQLCAPANGKFDFVKSKLPPYPYNKASCWSESASERSLRLREKQRPVASSHFRLSVDTHASLTGHVVMEAVLFPASGYVESILENGAMAVHDIQIHKPLVLIAHGADPGHAGCVINGNHWEFRASTTNTFDNGQINLDSVYASGTWSSENLAYDETNPLMFDVESVLSRSQASITGDEFYDAIPSAYQYQSHFRNYLKTVHEVPDDNSWGGLAYLTRLEIPEGTPDVFGHGYVIHPGILDSITQCGLAMLINMATKSFDFPGIFLPVKIDALTRWDSRDAPDLDEELKGGVWTYFVTRTWGPNGPFKSDYIIANSAGRVLFTIEGFEIARAPEAEPVVITDDSMNERLTTTWQSKAFPSSNFLLPQKVVGSNEYHEDLLEIFKPSLCEVFETLLLDAQAHGGRKVVRVVDLDPSPTIAKMLDSSMTSALENNRIVLEYFCAGITAENADAKAGALQYHHARSLILDISKTDENSDDLPSFDIALRTVDLSRVPVDFYSLAKLLGPSGVMLLLVSDSRSDGAPEDNTTQRMTLADFAAHLNNIPESHVQISHLDGGLALIGVRSTYSLSNAKAKALTEHAVIHHFSHGNEGQLVEDTKALSDGSELWILGDDDASGIGALGIAACIAAESPDFTVHSLLFEDHDVTLANREAWVQTLRQNPKLLEQHMKITRRGELYVRRLVHGSPDVKAVPIPSISVTSSFAARGLSARFPPSVEKNQMEVNVEALGVEGISEDEPLVTFVGTVTDLGQAVTQFMINSKVVGIAASPIADVIVADQTTTVELPNNVSAHDAASLPASILPAWIALADPGRVSETTAVLVHDAASHVGFGAVQVCQRLGARFFCTVATTGEANRLRTELNVDEHSIVHIGSHKKVSLVAKKWLRKINHSGFDIILNSEGKAAFATGIDCLHTFGRFIHHQKPSSEIVNPPFGAATTHVINVADMVVHCQDIVASSLAALLASHASQPFKVSTRSVALTELSHSIIASSLRKPLVIVPEPTKSVRIDPAGQLFNPRKSYVLVGGSSELGVRITEWMVVHGARHVLLTSRRGQKALTKVDLMYIRYLRSIGVEVEVTSADAVNQQDMKRVLAHANEVAPIGGVFLMTVVLRDGQFTNLDQKSFDDVYQSKVDALNTLLSCVNPGSLDFLLLFSTIGSVFGNAGQAAYCASQLYLDRVADSLPNTISMSFPPITDSGIFKRLVIASKGRANTSQLTKTGMTTAQVCNFIGDCLIRRIPHYVPMLAINDVPETFPTCEPLLYSHLLSTQLLATAGHGGKDGATAETPATLLAALVGLNPDQITENAPIPSFGLDSLAATRYSNQLKTYFNIKISQIELLGSTTVGKLNEMIGKVGTGGSADDEGVAEDDGAAKYGEPLIAILNDRLAYDEPYTTDASPHQYRIWLAQAEYDNARKRTASKIDPQMSRHGATLWDTHEGYFVTLKAETPLDVDRMGNAFGEVVQRHGALRTAFSWDEKNGKLLQTVYPTVDFQSELVDLSQEADPAAKAYELAMIANKEPNFKLDRLPLLNATMFDLGGGEWAFNVIIHHIIIDEASLGIFFYDLFAVYLKGPDSLPPVSLHYSDFSDWLVHTSTHRAELRDEQLKYWAETLKDVQPLHLTLAKPSSKELTPITQIEATMDSGVLAEYHKLISDAGVTAFAGFFAAYNVLLFKYSSQQSFVVGTAVTQRRNAPQLADVIGFFANMLPIKTTIDDDQMFAEYLASFKDSLMESLQNDDVTYEEIVQQGKSSSHGRGYFKHLFAPGGLNLDMVSSLEAGQMYAKSILPLPNGEEQYEFLLTVHTKTGQVVLRFDNFLYSEETARQFLDAYIGLVGTLGRDPHVKIRDVSAVSVAEHDRLVNELASYTDTPIPEHCLHQLVEEQALRKPRLAAVEFDADSLTYAELNSTANRIARSLIQQGVGSESVVALCFDRGIQQILAILAVLKAGGTFLPLDPDDPTLRKELMIVDCKAKVLLTTSSHSRDFEKSIASKVLVAYIDDPSYVRRLSRFDDRNLVVEGLTPSSLAYIMFTSGSTGKPKGVMIEHRSISNLIQNSHVYGFQQGVRVLSSLAYTFDPFIVDVFGTFAHGATLVTGRKELVLGDIGNAIKSLRINVLHVTPSILAVVPVEAYPTLETVVVAGEPLGKKLIEDWSKRVTLMNMYGPTEASVDCIGCHVTSPSLTGVIGRPLPNNRVYILDKQLRPTPIGVEGELFVGGIQLARGYLHQPELTAASFMPNPFVPSERLYRTGDIALYRPDGNIEYCGRQDRQIKLRGQRIELGEVEDVIMKYHGVQRSAVVIRTLQDAPALVAFVEFKGQFEAAVEDEKEALKLFIAERLPRFMYPSLIAALPQLPTSRSGKIDRSILKQMDLKSFAPDLSQELGLPQSDIESELLSIFCRLFKMESDGFGVSHDLFAVGLNSLMAVQAAGIISKTFNVHIGLSHMYLRPTIRELATLVIDAMGQDTRQIQEAEDNDADYLIELLPVKRKGILPRLFLIHDITGMATPFMRLGAFMPNEMYAIGDKHFGSPDGFATIDAMANHYITLIKSIQPHGPYVIAGYSYGGTIAVSMAAKLTQLGDQVKHLILFDPIFIPTAERQSLKSTDWTQRSIDRISENFPDIGEKWKTKLRTEIRKNLDAMFDHEPEYFDGPSTLVVPKDRAWYRNGHASDFDTGIDDRNGWDARLSNLDMKVAAGRHDTMFAPAHVKTLAGVLKEIFESMPIDQANLQAPSVTTSKIRRTVRKSQATRSN